MNAILLTASGTYALYFLAILGIVSVLSVLVKVLAHRKGPLALLGKHFGRAEYFCTVCYKTRRIIFKRSKGAPSIKCKCGRTITTPTSTWYW